MNSRPSPGEIAMSSVNRSDSGDRVQHVGLSYVMWQMTCSATHSMTWRTGLPVRQSNIPKATIPLGYQPDPWEKYSKCGGHELACLSRHSSPVFHKLYSYQLVAPCTALQHPKRFFWKLGRGTFCPPWS